MTKTIRQPVLLLVSTNSELIEATQQALAGTELLHLAEEQVSSRILSKAIVNTQPDVVLLDFENLKQPYFLVYKLAAEYPMFPSIAILPESKLEIADRVVQAGASAFVKFPFDSPAGLTTLISEYIQSPEPGVDRAAVSPAFSLSEHPTNTIAVFSPKGGTGCSTVATNFAIALHKTFKEDVLLLDGKHLFGHIALYLNLLSGNSITDLISQVGMLDQQLINQVVVKHKSGIHVLPSPNSVEGAQGITPEDLYSVLQDLHQVYPNIIIDVGSHLDENTVTYLDSSDRILLVLNPDLASMRDAKQFIKICENLSYPKEKIVAVLNQIGKKEEVKKEEIEKVLQMKIVGSIPTDEELALSCVNDGVPVIQKKPRHPISKAITDLVEEVDFIIQTGKSEQLENEAIEVTEDYYMPT